MKSRFSSVLVDFKTQMSDFSKKWTFLTNFDHFLKKSMKMLKTHWKTGDFDPQKWRQKIFIGRNSLRRFS